MFYSIQFLRGIAALMVVMTHVAHKGQQYDTGSLNWFHIGGDGVDLFFIISGFIMCFTTHNKDMTFLSFMKNRIERIIPLYWALTCIALAVFLVAPGLVNSSGGKTGIIESYFLIPNGDKFLIQNGWTLSYEFYYYFIFSVCIFLTHVRNIRYFTICCIICILACLGAIFKPASNYLSFLFSNMLLEFAFGIASFYIFNHIKPSRPVSVLMILAGIAYLIYKNNFGVPEVLFGKAITSGIPMFFIFLGFISMEEWFYKSKGRIVRSFEQLGNCSYSLYLVHPFILSPVALFLKKINMLHGPLFSVAQVLGSIAAGLLTYNFLEKPMTKFIKGMGKNAKSKRISKNPI